MRPADQHGLQLPESVEPHKGWRACWGKLHCFASSSRKRHRRRPQLLPAPLASNPSSNGLLQISESMPSSSSLSPLVHAPPSSPASFSYPDHLSSPAALLTLFPLKSAEDLCCNGMTRGDSSFRGLDPVLVTPPLHSTLTTEPTTPLSTAPFTPPPELAHLTTPPSPEVPYAEFVASSLSFKYGERLPEQGSMEASGDPPKLELTYQLYSGNPIGRSGASSVGIPSPLPERVPFLEDDGRAASLMSLLQAASPFGFNQATSADAYGHCSPELVYQHVRKNQHTQSENLRLEMQVDAERRNEHVEIDNVTSPSGDAECNCEAISKEQVLNLPDTDSQSRRSEIPGLLSENCAHNSCIERIEGGPEDVSCKKQPESSGMVQLDDQKEEPIPNTTQTSISAIRCFVEKHMEGVPDAGKCPTCGVLTSKCRALSEALRETKQKLSSIEEKENMLGDREKKFKQLIEWLQLEAKSQEASICRLSEELSWQELAFLDLQEKHLAELGVELSTVSRDFMSTEVSS